MTIKGTLLSATCAAGVIIAGPAAASVYDPTGATRTTTYSIDFTGDQVPQSALLFGDIGGSGVDLTVRASDFAYNEGNLTRAWNQSLNGGAGGFTQDALYDGMNVGRYSGGLGVCSGTVTQTGYYCSGDISSIDGYGTDIARTVNGTTLDATGPVGASDEMVVFMFSEMVRLVSVSFTGFDDNDQFVFRMFDPLDIYLTDLDANGDDDTNRSPTYRFADNWTGTMFGIGARENDDEFRISGLSFEHVAPIPLPAGGVLLLTALGGLALARRRKA